MYSTPCWIKTQTGWFNWVTNPYRYHNFPRLSTQNIVSSVGVALSLPENNKLRKRASQFLSRADSLYKHTCTRFVQPPSFSIAHSLVILPGSQWKKKNRGKPPEYQLSAAPHVISREMQVHSFITRTWSLLFSEFPQLSKCVSSLNSLRTGCFKQNSCYQSLCQHFK